MLSVDIKVQLSPEEIKNLANEQYKLGQYEEAILLYTRAIDTSPKTSTFYKNPDNAYLMKNNYKEAAFDSRIAINLDPTNAKAYTRAGKCHLNMGNLKESGRLFQRALELDPKCAQRYYDSLQKVKMYLAQTKIFMDNEQYALARNSLKRAISYIDPNQVPIKWRVTDAECALGEKNYSEATCIINSLIRLDPQNPDALFLRARVFYSQCDSKRTIDHCVEALRSDPDFSKARELLKLSKSIQAQKDRGDEAFKSKNLTEAYDAYTDALKIDQKNNHMNARLYSIRAAILQKTVKELVSEAEVIPEERSTSEAGEPTLEPKAISE
ncbi:hypothetical protein G6F56_006078 [Rhizopus delemar]|nr:hypothetical protein G6F56_006078 [Rhizopus delemar]